MRCHLLAVCVGMVALLTGMQAQSAEPLRAGVIGCDTSHVMAFYGALADPKAEGDLADVKIVAAFPGGTPDNPSSWDRVEKYTAQLREKGVAIVDSIPKLLELVDVVFLESVDGRPHLEQARPVILARKPLFVDKPIAASLSDALEIFRLAKEHNCPIFSSSSLRFGKWREANLDPKVGPVRGCDAWSPCSLEEHHPDLFWYGIHGVETLFSVMGTGCKSVVRVQTDSTELVVGTWADGRVGTFRGLRDGKRGYGAMVFGVKDNVAYVGDGAPREPTTDTNEKDKDKRRRTLPNYEGYKPLLIEICKFFRTGKPPVSAEETIEIIAFMEAADQSKRQGGCPVTLESVLTKAGSARQ